MNTRCVSVRSNRSSRVLKPSGKEVEEEAAHMLKLLLSSAERVDLTLGAAAVGPWCLFVDDQTCFLLLCNLSHMDFLQTPLKCSVVGRTGGDWVPSTCGSDRNLCHVLVFSLSEM